MEAIGLTENSRQEQLHRWNSLTPGAIFESTFSTLYLVVTKSDSQITVIPLSAQARASIISGGFYAGSDQLRFGDVAIERIFPMPDSKHVGALG